MSSDPARAVDFSVAAGFERVDDQRDPAALLHTMEQTSRWPAIIALRAFEADRLRLGPGRALLDVGCGRGEVACALAPSVLPGGRVVGIDASDAMLADARARAVSLGVSVDFRKGDALALDEPSASFDAVRAERLLQWLPDATAAVVELVRVLRRGGRLGLIDTDWRTLATDLPDLEAAAAVTSALWRERGPAATAGGRLVNLCRAAGLTDLELEAATHVWTSWDPDAEPAPAGLLPLQQIVPQLVDSGYLDAGLGARFIEQLLDAARSGRLFLSLTMFAVVASKP